MINAVVPIWKPIDWTSFDVVKKIRRYTQPSKVGHAGTLDPFAEGVLMLCIGTFTKNVESYKALRRLPKLQKKVNELSELVNKLISQLTNK